MNRRNFLLLAKIIISLLCVTVAIHFAQPERLWDALLEMNALAFASAVLLLIVGILLCGWRFHIFLRRLAPVQRRSIVAFYYETFFFNTLLPGGVAGELFKTYHLKRQGISVSYVAWTILLERFLGIWALACLAYAALLFEGRERLPDGATWLLFGASGGGAIAWLALLIGAEKLASRLGKIGQWITAHISRVDRVALLQATILSFVNQALFFAYSYLLAGGLGISLPFGVLAPALAAGAISSMLPISLHGLGFREGMFLILLAQYGIPAEKAVLLGLLTFSVNVVAALPGGILHILRPENTVRSPGPPPAS